MYKYCGYSNRFHPPKLDTNACHVSVLLRRLYYFIKILELFMGSRFIYLILKNKF